MTSEADQQQTQKTLILGMGNPLLDKQIQTGNTELHEKYKLKKDGAYLVLPDNEHCLLPLFEDLEQMAHMIEHVPGGSAQNTMRVFQWMVGAFGESREKGVAAYFGAVGNDQNAAVLKKLAIDAGLNVNYQLIEGAKTGTCGVLVHGTERCLIAYLGAAEQFTTSHLAKPENQQLIREAQNYYIEGYFLTVCPEGIQHIADHAAKSNKPFCMNLSAEYICSYFLDRLNALLPFVDLLFGNEQEARAYAQSNKFEEKEDLAKIVLKMAEIDKVNSYRKRTVVITCGSEPILVAQDGKIHQFSVDLIERHQIEDTNGAGDAFCGGFLAAMALGRPLDKCVAAGNFAARTIIQNSGCTFPAVCHYNEPK